MKFIDILILLIILLIVGFISYFNLIKPMIKNKNRSHCLICPMAYDKKAKRILNEYKRSIRNKC